MLSIACGYAAYTSVHSLNRVAQSNSAQKYAFLFYFYLNIVIFFGRLSKKNGLEEKKRKEKRKKRKGGMEKSKEKIRRNATWVTYQI